MLTKSKYIVYIYKGLHDLITLIQKRHKIMIEIKLLYYIIESAVDSYENISNINKTACRLKVHMKKRKRRNEF